MQVTPFPTAAGIEAAHRLIAPYIHRTPVYTNQTLSVIAGAELFFKTENFQKIGAFKARGALNAVLSLSAAERKHGVVAHSSGNHAQGVAYAAQTVGIPAYLVMPHQSPQVKIAGVRAYGAQVTFCENTAEDRQRAADEIAFRTGASFIHPFNNDQVITGQATAARELIRQTDTMLDYILCPVGGGGLLSGTALSAAYFSPGTRVIGAEPEGAADAVLSFHAGSICKAPYINTIADGLLTTLGPKTFAIIRQHVSDILTVSDAEIISAMRLIWERMKIIVEPSGAVPLAVALRYKERFQGKKVGIILTGGNVDLGKLPF